MALTVRCYAECGYATSYRLSVCDVQVPYRDVIGWNTSKIISRLISFRFMLGLTPPWVIWCSGNTTKLWWNRVGVMGTKTCNILKWCKIGPRLLWWNNRKLHMCFRFIPKSMTLDNLERLKCTLPEKSFYGAHQKNLRPILSASKCRSMILVSRNIRYCRYWLGFLWEGASSDSGVVDGNLGG